MATVQYQQIHYVLYDGTSKNSLQLLKTIHLYALARNEGYALGFRIYVKVNLHLFPELHVHVTNIHLNQ